MKQILEVSDLNYFYQDGDTKRYILKNVSMQLEQGKFYTILGESGSGKTTLLALLSALDEPSAGTVKFEGKDIRDIGYDTYRRNHIGIVFQSYNLIPYMTAVENVLVAMEITENSLPKDKGNTAYNLLEYVGIDRDRADRLVTKLSGGECQRVAIARSLATDVNIIVADEPTGNLDEEREAEIVEIFSMLAHKHNKCVVVVTHSRDVAQQSDVIFTLRKGGFHQDE